MVEKANAEDGLEITLADMTLFGGNGLNRPATGVSWLEAAQFVNWLNESTGHAPAYKFDVGGNFQLWAPSDPGYDASNLFRNRRATYFLPSTDEWYKAAYFDPIAGVYWGFPTASNSAPTSVRGGTTPGTAVTNQGVLGPAPITQAGGLSAFGTMAQGGNVSEREESAFDLINDVPLEPRGALGGSWGDFPSGLHAALRSGLPANSDGPGGGFRVASVVPEPSAALILGLAAASLVTANGTARQWRQRTA
jgi:formylglycine-generating enzyme required for sulfatase activity